MDILNYLHTLYICILYILVILHNTRPDLFVLAYQG
jgi:hypothetical protein